MITACSCDRASYLDVRVNVRVAHASEIFVDALPKFRGQFETKFTVLQSTHSS